MILKYGSVIIAAVSGSIILGYLIYLLVNSGSGGSGGGSSFQGYRSLDTLYDDSGGNDPLSNARLTSDINLSSDKYSCKFQVIYEGNNKRTVNCISGCKGDDEEAKFCKSYEYKDGDDLDNSLLDQTYVDRKDYTQNKEDSGKEKDEE